MNVTHGAADESCCIRRKGGKGESAFGVSKERSSRVERGCHVCVGRRRLSNKKVVIVAFEEEESGSACMRRLVSNAFHALKGGSGSVACESSFPTSLGTFFYYR